MRDRLTYSNVMASIAVFIALGGSAYAFQLGKNSVGSKQLKKNAVTTSKVKNEAITAAKVKKGTLTGNQINLASLGTVPEANHAASAETASTLQGSAPSTFMRGNGSVVVNRIEMDETTGLKGPVLLDLPGAGQISTGCDEEAVWWTYANSSAETVDLTVLRNLEAPFHAKIKSGEATAYSGSLENSSVRLEIATAGIPPVFADVQLTLLRKPTKPRHCTALGQATVAQ